MKTKRCKVTLELPLKYLSSAASRVIFEYSVMLGQALRRKKSKYQGHSPRWAALAAVIDVIASTLSIPSNLVVHPTSPRHEHLRGFLDAIRSLPLCSLSHRYPFI